MVHNWDNMTFLHWAYEPAEVQPLLAPGLDLETHDGQAWVGLLPFYIRVRPPGVPPLPWVSNFPETNVRTYVRGPDGRTGIYFFSLDAARLGAVLGARSTYQLPYFWADMDVVRRGDTIRYFSRRRWPGPSGASSTVSVDVGGPTPSAELTEFDHYLTARFGLWHRLGRGLAHTRAEHPPWPLRRARVTDLDPQLVTAAGLPTPQGAPLVHFSDGVQVRIGLPQPVRAP